MARKKAEEKEKDDKALSEKEKMLDLALKQIQKDYGDGAVMKLGENQKMNIRAISTGSLNLDIALGIGGVPRGRIVEIYGAESSGKQRLHFILLRKLRRLEGLWHLSMRNML